MLTTGMIGGPSIVFCRYAEAGVSQIRSHINEDGKTCRAVLGLDANSLYLFCSGQEMPCGKEKVFSERSGEKDKLIQNVLNDKLFGFFQVDIEVPEQLLDKFSEFSPLFILSEVPEDQIPQHMQDYKINTGRKKIKNNKKLLGVMKAEKILLYSPLLKWYLNHGLQVAKIHKYISYTSGRPFKWFPEEVSAARRTADQDKNKRQLGDTAKLKGNSFYGKMIENLEKHMNTKFTTDEELIDKIFRSPYFDDLEEISEGVFEVRQWKRQVTITRPYQCGIAVYQLAKLRMLEFYYDFVDKFCDRRDFEDFGSGQSNMVDGRVFPWRVFLTLLITIAEAKSILETDILSEQVNSNITEAVRINCWSSSDEPIQYFGECSTVLSVSRRIFQRYKRRFCQRRNLYYNNSSASFNPDYWLLLSGICPNPGPGPNTASKGENQTGLKLCHWNVQRLTDSKLEEIRATLTKIQPNSDILDVLFLTETFCSNKVPDSFYTVPGYGKDRVRKTGGGILAFVNVQTLKLMILKHFG